LDFTDFKFGFSEFCLDFAVFIWISPALNFSGPQSKQKKHFLFGFPGFLFGFHLDPNKMQKLYLKTGT
jgi:hypothetical protein